MTEVTQVAFVTVDTHVMDTRTQRARRTAGFSLIELMIITVILGVLATIAIPVFHVYQLRTKSAEAGTNIGAISIAELSYFSEFGQFLTIAPEPPTIPGPRKVTFDGAGSGFAEIGFNPQGSVYFSYGVTASADGSGFAIDAGSDIDGDGIVQFWGYVKPDGAGGIPAGQVGCNTAALAAETIGPCSVSAGRSVF